METLSLSYQDRDVEWNNTLSQVSQAIFLLSNSSGTESTQGFSETQFPTPPHSHIFPFLSWLYPPSARVCSDTGLTCYGKGLVVPK